MGRDGNNLRIARPHGCRYPWREWFSRGRVDLLRGVHYHGQPHGFAATARQAAERLGLRVGVLIRGDRVTLWVKERGKREGGERG